MANKKVNQLTSKPAVNLTDLFLIADPTSGQAFKTTITDLGTAIGSGVSSVNSLVGAVVLDTDDIQELVSPTNKWFTDTRARAALSASSPLTYNSGTGAFGIQVATGSQNGYLSSTDWTTFNSKVSGSGTTNYIPKFTDSSVLGNSNIQDSGTLITLNSITNISNNLWIGSISSPNSLFRVNLNLTGLTTMYGVRSDGTTQPDVTIAVNNFASFTNTASSSFTLDSYIHYSAQQGTIGAGSIISGQYGFLVTSNFTSAVSNYGFYGNIPSGTNRYNLYMNGTADNYLSGNLGVGVVPGGARKLEIQLSDSTTYTNTSLSNGLSISNISTTTNSFSGIFLSALPTSGSAARASINLIATGAGSGDLAFSTRNSSTQSEKLRILSNGNVLINSTSDDAVNKLQVTGSARVTTKLRVGNSQVNTNTTTSSITSTAKTIYTRAGNGKSEFVFVMGDVGGTAYFADLVSFASGASVVVISSTTTYGLPSVRTYSVSGDNLQLSIASGTAETQVFPISGS